MDSVNIEWGNRTPYVGSFVWKHNIMRPKWHLQYNTIPTEREWCTFLKDAGCHTNIKASKASLVNWYTNLEEDVQAYLSSLK